jgi:membrane-bound lytic murein transglycosylase B
VIRDTPPVLAALGRLGAALLLLAATAGGVGLLHVLSTPAPAPVAGPPPVQPVEPAQVEPGSTAPEEKPLPELPAAAADPDPVRQWADQVAAVVDIPARAVVAYVNAELAMREHQPGCHLSWATMAGIGRIESNHGRFAGRRLGEDGRPSAPIIGIALDGSPGVRAIPDTDGGLFDGDAVFDRAVGPLQFIPSTWNKWATDGNGDGIGDPQNIDDAAMAAARYLCAGGRDLSTGAGWWSAVMSYNNSVEYAQKVFAMAERYAEVASRRS